MAWDLPDELKLLRTTVREFVERELIPIEMSVPDAEEVPDAILKPLQEKAKALGLWLIDAPEELGGAGLSLLAQAVITEEVARTVAMPFRGNPLFGPHLSPILRACNADQRERYVEPVLRGEKRACFAQTEPDAGTDPSAMRTRAVRDGSDWLINGTKRFITLAHRSDFATVLAVTDPDAPRGRTISCFLVDLDTPGVQLLRSWPTMMSDAPWEIAFEDVRVPAQNLVGEEGGGFALGQGFLTVGRVLGHGAHPIGVAQRALELAIDYAKTRVTFGEPLSERQAIQFMIADSATEIHAARLMVHHCAALYDAGLDTRNESYMVKIYCSEMVNRVVDRAIQIHGSIGLTTDLPLERWYRQMRSIRITEGATEVMRWRLARNLIRSPTLMLDGYTVLDLTDLKGHLAGKLLAELGARVIKAEPPEGDPLRRLGPFKAGVGPPEGSLRFAFLNGGKESIVVADDDELERLAGEVDVVLESGQPGQFPVERLRAARPDIVVASLTGFGQDGPHAGFQAPDIVVFAMGGVMSISGEPGRAPVCAPGAQSFVFGSVCAALAVVLALRRRELSGRGEHVDISFQEALASQEHLIREAAYDGVVVTRVGSQHKHVAPGRIFPCRDGHVVLFVSAVHWKPFLANWSGHPIELDAPEWATQTFRHANAARLNAHVEGYTRRFDKLALSEQLQEAGIPCLPVYSPAEFLADEHVRSRAFTGAVEHPAIGRYDCPQLPVLVDGHRLPAKSPPLLNAHNGRPTWRPPSGSRSLAAPLEGIRVVSLTTGIAGPNAARLLANSGADVIKVESRAGGLDAFRFFGPDLDASPRFLETNLDVRSLTLNLKQPAGVELFLELVATADVVVENFRPDVLPRLGLGYEALKAVRPDIIVARMPGLGSTGPRSMYGTWGPTLSAFAGLTYLWNHAGQPEPIGSQGVYPDYLAGVFAPFIVVAALLRRLRTGEGALLDFAQAEAAAYALGPALLEVTANGSDPAPVGNTDSEAALHGCYPCRGQDRWCVIACSDEAEWERLCVVSGVARDVANRDAAVGAWTASLDAYVLMADLQAVGIACGVVQNAADLVCDPHLEARGFIQTVIHPRLGEVRLAGLPYRLSDASARPYRPAPLLGEHNQAILCDLLGHSHAELAAWEADGVVA